MEDGRSRTRLGRLVLFRAMKNAVNLDQTPDPGSGLDGWRKRSGQCLLVDPNLFVFVICVLISSSQEPRALRLSWPYVRMHLCMHVCM